MTVEPYDEVQIDPNDKIIRRINPVQHVVWDENRNRNRISTKAYSPSSDAKGGMSVDVEALISLAGIDAHSYVTTPVYTGSVAFSASAIRAQDLLIGYDPIPENPYHAEVWGKSRPNRFSDTQKRGLGKAAFWYVELADVDIN